MNRLSLSASLANSPLRNLIATLRSRIVSWARYTSPIPPSPSFVPGERLISIPADHIVGPVLRSIPDSTASDLLVALRDHSGLPARSILCQSFADWFPCLYSEKRWSELCHSDSA